MIAKQIKGKDFYGVLAYNQKKINKQQGCVIDSNIIVGSVVMQTKEFNVVRQLRPNLAKVVYHTSINLPYSDKLSDKEFANLARDYLEEMGFDNNQYIIYKHTDQEHSHIHIVANRVKFSGEVVSDSQDFKRSELLIRKLEKKYNLTQLVQKDENTVMTKGEIEKSLRTGNVPERLELQNSIQEILNQTVLIGDFLEKLKKKGISTKFNKGSNGTISGISFHYKGSTYKGSKVHRNLSWNTIKSKLNYEQIRDNSTISAFDDGTRKNESETDRTIKTNAGSRKKNDTQSEFDLEQSKREVINKIKFSFKR